MRLVVTIIASLLLASVPSRAASGVFERTYIVTDRDVYLAGEQVGCSAFCLDAATRRPSTVSSVAYLELHSAEGLALTAKIGLMDGRGAGFISLPKNLPTGSYRLIAYTSLNKNEEGYDWNGVCSKTISVYNTRTRERVKGGVKVVDDLNAVAVSVVPSSSASLQLEYPSQAVAGEVVPLSLLLPEGGSVSVSVFREDAVPHRDNATIEAFLDEISGSITSGVSGSFMPDYDGEVIRAHVAGIAPDKIAELAGNTAFIAAPGNKSDVYYSVIDSLGQAVFYTGNILGRKELVSEIEDIDSTSTCHLEIVSPFVTPAVEAPAPLVLHPSLAEDLQSRSSAMQVVSRFASDTLYEWLPVRDNLLFNEAGRITYHLDDYTRFPLMREVFVEFIPEIRARMLGGRRDIQVRLRENDVDSRFSEGSSLIMLDGVPVPDHDKIYNYDPLLVESINIYPFCHVVGPKQFDGIVNFVTYKRNLPSMRFSGNVRVIDFQGVLYPAASTGLEVSGLYPDYRQTALWHPLVNLEPGIDTTLEFHAPLRPGRYSIVVEGITSDGRPVYCRRQMVINDN